jgi:peptidoglycan/LPS O-acetylase OafA/YrhL
VQWKREGSKILGKGCRIIELDGLRGLAVISVVLAHYFGEVDHRIFVFDLGWLGVDLFFVLSGFLIGGILINNRGSVSFFSTFFIRRALRIFPIYYLVLILALALSDIARGHSWADLHFPPLVYVMYVQNIAASLSALDGKSFQPLWTLAVEEQFYLLAPFFIYFCPPRLLGKIIVAMIMAAPALRALLLLSLPYPQNISAEMYLPCRWDALLLGVLAALALRHSVSEVARYTSVLRGVALLCIISTPILLILGSFLFVAIGLTTISVFFAIFILLIANRAEEGKRFRAGWLRYFGKISYCLYLIHQPVTNAMHGLILGSPPDIGGAPQVAVTFAALAVSIVFASLSWTYFERPLLGLGKRWHYYAGLEQEEAEKSRSKPHAAAPG